MTRSAARRRARGSGRDRRPGGQCPRRPPIARHRTCGLLCRRRRRARRRCPPRACRAVGRGRAAPGLPGQVARGRQSRTLVTNFETVGMPVRAATRFTAGLALALLMLLAASAVQAEALTNVRFLDAAAGAAPGRLEVRTPLTTAVAGGQSDFGEITPYAATPSGGVQLQFVSAHGRASTSARLTPGARYT